MAKNVELILRNRKSYLRDRYAAMVRAEKILKWLIDNFLTFSAQPERFDEIGARITNLMKELEQARFFARRAVGGNPEYAPPQISVQERAYVDHIETLYSNSRTIERFYRHHRRLRQLVGSVADGDSTMEDFMVRAEASDREMIYHHLLNMRFRIESARGIQSMAFEEDREDPDEPPADSD
jgi:hypothetical protein